MKYLTNERLKKYFSNNFELANQAIAFAREVIGREEEFRLDDLIDNLVNLVKSERSL